MLELELFRKNNWFMKKSSTSLERKVVVKEVSTLLRCCYYEIIDFRNPACQSGRWTQTRCLSIRLWNQWTGLHQRHTASDWWHPPLPRNRRRRSEMVKLDCWRKALRTGPSNLYAAEIATTLTKWRSILPFEARFTKGYKKAAPVRPELLFWSWDILLIEK